MAPKRWQNIALFCPQPIAEMDVGQKWASLRQMDQLCPTMRKACHLVNMHSETPSVECNFELLCSASVYATRTRCLVSDRARQLERLQLATSARCQWVALTSTLTHTFLQFQIGNLVLILELSVYVFSEIAAHGETHAWWLFVRANA